MKILYGDVVPGEGIGDYLIGMKKEELLNMIGIEYTEWERGDGFSIISIENAKFWVECDNSIRQIGVTKGFKGNYNDNIRLGTTLQDVRYLYGEYEESIDTYNIKGIDGLCFELEDIDDWDELTAPIEWIFVYR